MANLLDKLVIRTCEKLPLDITLFESEGACTKPSDICEYCKFDGQDYHCTKISYTAEFQLHPE